MAHVVHGNALLVPAPVHAALFPGDRPALARRIVWGGLIGNLTTMYVTDKAAYRLYAGTYDDESEFIHVQAVSDWLTLTKMHDRSRAMAMGLGDQPVIEKRVLYSLQHLRQAHSFE